MTRLCDGRNKASVSEAVLKALPRIRIIDHRCLFSASDRRVQDSCVQSESRTCTFFDLSLNFRFVLARPLKIVFRSYGGHSGRVCTCGQGTHPIGQFVAYALCATHALSPAVNSMRNPTQWRSIVSQRKRQRTARLSLIDGRGLAPMASGLQ